MRAHTAKDELPLHKKKCSLIGNMQVCTCIADTVFPVDKVQPRICVLRNTVYHILTPFWMPKQSSDSALHEFPNLNLSYVSHGKFHFMWLINYRLPVNTLMKHTVANVNNSTILLLSPE
jgi:hypothetical protein